jgi:N-acetylmuramoyl-L-alanine amidase
MTYDMFLLALCMWREARGEGADGMIAVGCCIRNRAHDWGQTFNHVIVGQNQFSSMTIKGDPNTVLYPPENDAVFDLARDIVEGLQPDTTGGAHYYANEQAMTSAWYETHIVNDPVHPVTATIGKHVFRR